MSCPTGKIPYVDAAEAGRALRGYTARKGPSPLLQAYRCPECAAWHLGRNPKLRKRGERRRW